MPTPADTRGDFSGSTRIIRDPGTAARTPFPGNLIPAGRLDSIGVKVAAFYPAPNVPGQPSGNANFRTNGSTKEPSDVYVGRLDHVFNAANRVYGRLLTSAGGPVDSPVWATPGTDPFHRTLSTAWDRLIRISIRLSGSRE